MMTLSVIISFSIDHGLAPIALRMPNSWVRSFTVMSMMFDTPTIPLSRVNNPTIHKKVRMMPMPVLICMFCEKRFHNQMARSSSGAAWWFLLMRSRYLCSKFSLSFTVGSPWNEYSMSPTVFPLPYMVFTVVNAV